MLIVRIDRTVKKLFNGGFFTKIPPLLTKNEFLKTLTISFYSTCLYESISVLLVKIGRTVENLFQRQLFSRKFPDCSFKTNFENLLKFLCVSAC
jgi:hypothetical protein